MRRQGHYGDSGGHSFASSQMQHMSGQRMDHKSGHYQERPEPMTSDKEHPYGTLKAEVQWRWERDGSSHIQNEGHVGDAPRSYYQGQRSDPRLPLEKQGNIDPRSQSHEGDTEVGYENNLLSEAFEGLEQRFLDDIIKLAKEQTDAEDAENARHREKIMTINAQYEEQLAALRTRHTNRREEFLRKESHARQQQYQQAAMDQYPNRGVGPGDPHGYSAAAGPGGEPHPYSADQYDSYRERARYLGGARDRGFDPKGQHPGGRVYNTGSRYY